MISIDLMFCIHFVIDCELSAVTDVLFSFPGNSGWTPTSLLLHVGVLFMVECGKLMQG